MNKTPYFVRWAKEFGDTITEYLDKTKFNYVIIEGISPVVWHDGDDDGNPVVFGSVDDAFAELANWPSIRNISIITEEDYIKSYMGTAWDEWYGNGEENDDYPIMDETNGHNVDLVMSINRAWKKNREMFKPILCALYERDLEEICNSDAFADFKLADKDKVFVDMQTEWDFHAYNYLMHIADDTDLESIINFVHYPYLPIYND